MTVTATAKRRRRQARLEHRALKFSKRADIQDKKKRNLKKD